MGWNEILRTFNIPGDGMLQRWIEQYRKFGTCVDKRYLVIENLYLNSSITKYMYGHKVCL